MIPLGRIPKIFADQFRNLRRQLPQTATAPFCPSEVQGSVLVDFSKSLYRQILQFLGPGLLIAVGYMDPGNWATDIEAGSRYGYSLLFVVLAASLSAMILQYVAMKLGMMTGRDLAQWCRAQYSVGHNRVLWVLAELAIVATDVAEVLGSALAFKLLLGVNLWVGVLLTGLDSLIVLGLKGQGFRRIEAIMLGLVATISICFLFEIIFFQPVWSDVIKGFWPHSTDLAGVGPWYIAVGIFGATVMPHNLYLHSSVAQTRKLPSGDEHRRRALRLAGFDVFTSLSLAFLVNAAILVLAGTAFHHVGGNAVTEIDDAYHLLEPALGGAAGLLFGIALLASGQSSTFTGTIAGQVMMEGFLQLKMPCWKRRVITRSLALIPALIGVLLVGEHGVGKLLVLSQVVLSLQLPFAIFPLLQFTGNRQIMGVFVNSTLLRIVGWLLFAVISSANIWLLWQLLF